MGASRRVRAGIAFPHAGLRRSVEGMAIARERGPSKDGILKRAREESSDPATQKWLDDIRAAAIGTLMQEADAQPDARAVVEEWRKARSRNLESHSRTSTE